MRLPEALKLCSELSAVSRESYEVWRSGVRYLGVTPFYVRKKRDRGALKPHRRDVRRDPAVSESMTMTLFES